MNLKNIEKTLDKVLIVVFLTVQREGRVHFE